MAWMETHYWSFSIGSNITLNVLIPTPTSSEQVTDMNHTRKYSYEAGLPVLYLLHGAYGDAFSWMRFSNIDRYAQEHGIAVVMADAGMSFYQNLASGRRYEDLFASELPRFTTNVFPVSHERSKTFIAGLSMGGYGAWYLGLKYPQQYAGAASLSGAVDIASLYEAAGSQSGPTAFNWRDAFQDDCGHLAGSGHDLITLYDQDAKRGCVPKLFQAVGTSDFLYDSNQKIRQMLQERGADLAYEEGPGGHEWDFWDAHIQSVLDWIDTIR